MSNETNIQDGVLLDNVELSPRRACGYLLIACNPTSPYTSKLSAYQTLAIAKSGKERAEGEGYRTWLFRCETPEFYI